MDSDYKILNIAPAKFPEVVEMCNTEWTQLLTDMMPFMITDPAGFFVGELDGEVVSSCKGTKYQNYAHIGLYFVKKEHRGKNYGLSIFNHVMKYLKDMPTIGLHAAIAQIPNYKKQGLEIYSFGNEYARKASGQMSKNLVNVLHYDFEKLLEYDIQRFGDCRRRKLKAFKEEHTCKGYILLYDDKIRGYGFIRGTSEPFKIGPFVADDKGTAKELLSGLQSLHIGKIVNINVLDVTTELIQIIKEEQWTAFSPFASMFMKGKLPSIDFIKPYSPIMELG